MVYEISQVYRADLAVDLSSQAEAFLEPSRKKTKLLSAYLIRATSSVRRCLFSSRKSTSFSASFSRRGLWRQRSRSTFLPLHVHAPCVPLHRRLPATSSPSSPATSTSPTWPPTPRTTSRASPRPHRVRRAPLRLQPLQCK